MKYLHFSRLRAVLHHIYILWVFFNHKEKVTSKCKIIFFTLIFVEQFKQLTGKPFYVSAMCAAFLLTVWNPSNVEASLEGYNRLRPMICHLHLQESLTQCHNIGWGEAVVKERSAQLFHAMFGT